MVRQRIRTDSARLGLLGRLVLVLAALALVWYGLMLVLLALKVAPATVESISGYRSIFDELAALESPHGTAARAIVAGAGVAAFLLFGYLALAQIPRPRLARTDVVLDDAPSGSLTVEPRAIERVAEAAAAGNTAVSAAAGRWGTDDLAVSVHVARARDVPGVLADVRSRVHAALTTHDLPDLPVNVTLGGFDRQSRRELD
ncbi:hypothetical protein [Conexibacter sp. CPCC 206217]|uniref:hypothetical protein n=1 Tax=Conexibacter sp. CPCC 206217 TaxID=3064574 RepID=UPI0027291648|nr:hypothetical protein [Conexibacter sp. CPCC 206217]MDO8212180.1 hypothetical protein [Conexibacter sp. CPCC 206217]